MGYFHTSWFKIIPYAISCNSIYNIGRAYNRKLYLEYRREILLSLQQLLEFLSPFFLLCALDFDYTPDKYDPVQRVSSTEEQLEAKDYYQSEARYM